ncbi:MAG: hypothetical protein OSB00_02690 [Sphingomonas bacterium]|nr:hypothetical protein [Sphingomonas bacterium]
MTDQTMQTAAPLDIDYIMRRSADEARQTILASDPRAAAAHEELCRRYVDLALAALGRPHSAASNVSAA